MVQYSLQHEASLCENENPGNIIIGDLTSVWPCRPGLPFPGGGGRMGGCEGGTEGMRGKK